MSYIIQSTKLSQDFIDSEIKNCLDSLYNTNEMLLDYWLSELYINLDTKEQCPDSWNEENLQEMYDDVDSNRNAVLEEAKVRPLVKMLG